MSNHSKTLAILLSAIAFGGCSRSSKPAPWYVERLQVSESSLTSNPALAVDVAEVQRELAQALTAAGRFQVLEPKAEAPKGAALHRFKLEVAFTRESQEGDAAARAAVGVQLEVRRVEEAGRFEAAGLGEAEVSKPEPEARVEAFREALRAAIAQAVETQALQLASLEKTDAALIADLQSKDRRVRDFAVRALSDRRNAAAVPALIERLNDPDREVVMRAIGALGAIGDPKAVPPLIELTRNREADFLLSVIEVIASIGGPDAEAYLFTLASGHTSEAVRQVAEEAQERLKQRALEAKKNSQPERKP